MYQKTLFYSLNDLAEQFAWKPETILDAALNKKIELMVNIPPGYNICLSSGNNDTPNYYKHPLMAVPNLLV